MEMESILENLKVLNNAIFVISGALNFKNLVNFSLKKGAKIHKIVIQSL